MNVDYSILTKHIESLSKYGLGDWAMDRDNPCQFPFVLYSETVHELIEAVLLFAEQNDMKQYGEVLDRNSIEWSVEAMSRVDTREISRDVVFAMLLGAVRAERFCEGFLLELLNNGSILKWLNALEEKEIQK